MKRAFNLLHKLITEFFIVWRNFSFFYALYGLIWWLCFYFRPSFSYKLSTWAIRKKTNFLDQYITQHYSDILEDHAAFPPLTKSVEEYRIWVFWGQGEQEMPPLVKACYRQLTHFNENVTLVTLDNISNFISISPLIFEKVNDGRISWAYFSDIVRTTLLATYGGLWLDATVWVSKPLPIHDLLEASIFTANGEVPVTNRSVRFWSSFDWNWSGWCLGAKKQHNPLFSFVSKMTQAIAVRENCLPDYVIVDYLIYYACRNIIPVRRAMENQPIKCHKRNELANMMSQAYDINAYRELTSTDFIFKLSFRSNWILETPEGNETFYARILSNTITPIDPEKENSFNKKSLVRTEISH